jgi:4-coumarate--CoA ligase
MLIPPIMVALVKSRVLKKYDLSSLRFIMTGGAPVGSDLCEELMRTIPSLEQISQGYGMTEESMASHLPVFGVKNMKAVGRLAANFEMKVFIYVYYNIISLFLLR